MQTVAAYLIAAVAEIAGCYAVWMWLRLDRSALWLIPALGALFVFAVALTWAQSPNAGRAFAAYGGVYIAASLGWMGLVEKSPPDRWDLIGAAICLTGAAVILAAPRGG
ncbi:YnfA family protein [Pelagovum sp. HNIBRBA483]|uniref:YnfA family protein n=1 Tax=Pelagovum sp. HNIBRBA483 TaxID=3233341 RepID=UPI0034A23C7B